MNRWLVYDTQGLKTVFFSNGAILASGYVSGNI